MRRLAAEIDAVLAVARPETDEVVLKVESPGGTVTGYGLAAAEVMRLTGRKVKVTACVDQVAASGGYLMACAADRIVAAPFALVGSIGVVAQVPNLHRLLKRNDIDYEEMTAGEYKRSVSVLGEITPQGREHFRGKLDATHEAFKRFVQERRPGLDIAKVGDGDVWLASEALGLGLVDALATSDEFLFAARGEARLYEIAAAQRKSLAQQLFGGFGAEARAVWDRVSTGLGGTARIGSLRGAFAWAGLARQSLDPIICPNNRAKDRTMPSAASKKGMAKVKPPRKAVPGRARETAPPWSFVMDLGLSKKQLAEIVGLKPEALYKARRANAAKTVTRLAEMAEILNRVAVGRADARKRSLVSKRTHPGVRRPHRRVAGEVGSSDGLARLSRFDRAGRICVRFQGLAYRAHDPRWSFKPLSGEGAAVHGGRFNPKGSAGALSRAGSDRCDQGSEPRFRAQVRAVRALHLRSRLRGHRRSAHGGSAKRRRTSPKKTWPAHGSPTPPRAEFPLHGGSPTD